MFKYPKTFFKSIPPDVVDFIKAETLSCEENSVDIVLTNTKSVALTGSSVESNGCFEETEGDEVGILSCAVGKPIEEWLPTFVHESCHKDQCVERAACWVDNYFGDLDSMGLIELWLEKYVELSPQQKMRYFSASILVELDCEVRSVDKIKQWNLPIDTDEYIQKSNAYVLFYHIVRLTRQWYEIGREPYNVHDVWGRMPKTWMVQSKYTRQPDPALLGIIADGTMGGSAWEETLKMLEKNELRNRLEL